MTNVFQFADEKQARSLRAITSSTVAEHVASPVLEMRSRSEVRALPAEPVTETGRNLRLRTMREAAWHTAEIATQYWRTKLAHDENCILAARHGIIPSLGLYDVDARTLNVENWRKAQLRQMLTPAPTMAAVAWKRQAFARKQYQFIGGDPAKIERAIADDAAWLAAHPTRRDKPVDPVECARRREHKEAVRGRIKEIAASLNLSDGEVVSVSSLRPHQIVRFILAHGVNAEWLQTGEGSAFQIETAS